MGAVVVQMEIFPSVTEVEKQAVRSLLRRYPKMKLTVELLKDKARNERQQALYSEWRSKVEDIEMAISLIMDPEVKRLIEYRFIHGNPRKAAVIKFNVITDRSIDRRINEGIDSIASTLKLMGASL
ncbi:hypothetical protein E6C60_1994 [Paenibacillus algicola]|uniref:Uncharacterized protein n=1 Tax=Paenibacillus algicola TaxID=2565926 RepID=A0A4P8XQI8_9BACL|nr:hypothetical protein [Paenibacillus algicola]QCT02709.1 hypothetical protein E6C60_1994 [Paenibacillus algicola]